MRFIHTADWHLGRVFHGVHLTDDQAHVLAQFTQLVRDCKPDAVVIAGDVYDRAVPPPDAVKLLDDVLSELVLDIEVPVLLIAGNHDSPSRLSFGRRRSAGKRLYVAGSLVHPCEPLVLTDGHGPVRFYSVPFAEPGMVRACYQCKDAVDHNSAMRHMLDRIREDPTGGRRVLIAHAFVAGGSECESERPLSVGTAGTVDADCFRGFDYVALGHLHEAQTIRCANEPGEGRIRYSGSPLKYSFDEAAHEKTVFVVDMDGAGACVCEPVALPPRRDVRRVERMADLLAGPADGRSPDDYLEVTLLDDGPVLDAVGQLRAVYPNVLSLKRAEKGAADGEPARPKVEVKRHRELFKGFFAHATGDDLTAEQEAAYAAAVEAMFAAERES